LEESPVYQVVGAVHVKSRWIYAIGEPCAEHSGTQASGWMLEMSGWAKNAQDRRSVSRRFQLSGTF
jgi:hypothetical protein